MANWPRVTVPAGRSPPPAAARRRAQQGASREMPHIAVRAIAVLCLALSCAVIAAAAAAAAPEKVNNESCVAAVREGFHPYPVLSSVGG